MDDAGDQHDVLTHRVENPVLAMDDAADALAELGHGGSRERMAAEQAEGFVKPAQIGIRNLTTKLGFAIIIDVRKVGPCLRTWFNSNHAVRDVPR